MLKHAGERKLSPKFISIHADWASFNSSIKPIRLIKATDGRYYEVRKTPFALFSIGTEPIKELSNIKSNIEWAEGFQLNIPKIPSLIRWQIYERFKEAFPNECLLNICFDEDKMRFYLVEPEQVASASSVEYLKTDNLVIMEIHSHGRARAYFSKTDDADELATGFYGVIGKVNTLKPELRVRYSCGGRYKEFDPSKIFDMEV